MTTSSATALVTPSNSPFRDDPEELAAAQHLWHALVGHIAGRAWMRLYVPHKDFWKKGKYDDSSRLTPRNLPDRPAAACIFNGRGRTGVLVFDFDISRSSADDPAAEVERDANQLIGWIRELGGVVVADRSTTGGIHVYVPLAKGELLRCDSLQPMYQQLQRLLPTLDIQPTTNAEQGCITPPGARCWTGGFRTLLGMTVEEAVAVFKARSAPALAARLRGVANEQLELVEPDTGVPDAAGPAARADYTAGPEPDERLPAEMASTAALRPWIPAFLAHGTVPDLRARDHTPWTPSHARLSVLHHFAARGWSLNDIRATRSDRDWAGFWAGYNHRKDHVKRLTIDWARAFDQARKRLTSIAEKSSQPVHKLDQLHTGGDTGIRSIRWKLAAARKWILLSGEFRGQQQWTALMVVTSLAAAIAMTRGNSAAVGGRWLAVAAGLCGQDTVHSVLRKFRTTDGSPVRYLGPWNAREHSGDHYTLTEPRLDGEIVRAAEWEAFAARPDPIDPVWRELGHAAWWVYTILQAIEPGLGETVAPNELAAAARVSLSTVHRAARQLQEHGLVDVGHGWVARTGRPPQRVPDLSAAGQDRRAERIARNQRQQAQFWGFWDVVTANFTEREITGYRTAAEADRDTPAYLDTVCPTATPPTTSPPDPGPDEPLDDEDAAALALLQHELGATLIDSELAVT